MNERMFRSALGSYGYGMYGLLGFLGGQRLGAAMQNCHNMQLLELQRQMAMPGSLYPQPSTQSILPACSKLAELNTLLGGPTPEMAEYHPPPADLDAQVQYCVKMAEEITWRVKTRQP